MKKFLLALMALLLLGAAAWASNQQVETTAQTKTDIASGRYLLISDATIAPASQTSDQPGEAEFESTKPGGIHRVIFYIPNRILDFLDMVRLRARIGPGLAVGVRATDPFSVFFGGYMSVYAGLPGPRLKPTVKFPIGLENQEGVGVSIFNLTYDAGLGPDYSQTEIGASFQALIAGLDVTVDPIEVLDFALGLIFIDIRQDDF